MRTINISNEKKRDAVVGFESKTAKSAVSFRLPDGKEKQNIRVMKAAHSIDDSMLLKKWGGPEGLGEAIMKKDPDIDFKKIGMFVSGTRKVYLKPDWQVAYSVELNEVLKNPDGTEKTHRPLGQNEANVSSEV